MTTELNVLTKLATWARERKILPPEWFACPNYAKCQESRRRGKLPLLDAENTCMMSYVGRDYGLPDSGKEFRLAIVGMDHGRSDRGDFAQRQGAIEDAYYNARSDFNPHYRGVIKTAAAILGLAGRYCQENCAKGKCAGKSRPNGTRCVLRSFAQPNLVKCTAATDQTCRATPEMYHHCSRHLVTELEVLKPSLVVFHGAPARWAFPLAVHEEGRKISPVLDGPFDKSEFPVVQKFTGTEFECFVLFLAHPSRGFLERQWKKTVEPALDFLRARNAIPT